MECIALYRITCLRIHKIRINMCGNIVAKATVMDVSTVSILPDLRSPETIQNDIVEKEKMLANLLGFDPTKINSEKRKENWESQNSDKEKLNRESRAPPIDHEGSKPIILDAPPRIKNTEKCESQGTSKSKSDLDDVKVSKPVKEESKKTMQAEPRHKSSVEKDKPCNQIVPSGEKKVESNFGAAAKIIPNGLKLDIPDCRAMPESWKVFELSLQKKVESPDPSLADWEIV